MEGFGLDWLYMQSALSSMFSYLSPTDVFSCRLVCKLWKVAADKDVVWFWMAQRFNLITKKVLIQKDAKREEGVNNDYIPPPLDVAPTWKILVLRNFCVHLQSLQFWEKQREIVSVHGMEDRRCDACNKLNCWICLQCNKFLCGRQDNAHMLAHHKESKHNVVVNVRDLLVWCFDCDRYLPTDKPILEEKKKVFLIKRLLYTNAFYNHRIDKDPINHELEYLGYPEKRIKN